MKISLVFQDWQNREGKSIYFTEAGVELSLGDFHHGTVFDGELRLEEESDAAMLQAALEAGFRPVFYLV